MQSQYTYHYHAIATHGEEKKSCDGLYQTEKPILSEHQYSMLKQHIAYSKTNNQLTGDIEITSLTLIGGNA